MNEHVTIRRWALKEGHTEAELMALVRDALVPAYAEVEAVVRQALLRSANPAVYVAITYWKHQAAYEQWTGDGGANWREAHRSTLESWLQLMAFQDETEAELLLSTT